MAAVDLLKVCFFGTAFSLLAALYGLVDSVGGLMFVQTPHHKDDEWTVNVKQASSSPLRTRSSAKKHIGL